MCPFQLDYLSQSFWSLWGKSVPLSQGISSIFDLVRVYLEVRRPWADEINGQIGFFPMIPVEENHKPTRRFRFFSAHWTRLCFCCCSSCNRSVIQIHFNWSNFAAFYQIALRFACCILTVLSHEEEVVAKSGRGLRTVTLMNLELSLKCSKSSELNSLKQLS